MSDKFIGLHRISANTIFMIGVMLIAYVIAACITRTFRHEQMFTKDTIINLILGALCAIVGIVWLTLL